MRTTHQISLPGGRTLFARSQPGEGMPVVLLHGLFGSSASWAEVCSGLDRPCIAFDLPGFGGSDLPTRPDVAAYAEDVAAGLSELGVDRFELVGHSFGGAVAAALAERLPARVTNLLLLAPAGFGRIASAELATAPGLCRAATAALPRMLRRRGIAVHCTATVVEASRRATVALVRAGRSAARMAAYRGPVTALWGSADTVVPPRHGRGVLASFPQTDVVLMDGVGHHPQHERAAALRELVSAGRLPRGSRRSQRTRRALPLRLRLPRLRLA